MSKINIRGVEFDSVNMDMAMEKCSSFLNSDDGRCRVIHTPNAEICQLCVEKNEYYPLINSADLVLPDGAGVILASKILRKPLEYGKVAGIELCENLIKYCAENHLGVYFLGGKPDVARLASEKMAQKYSGLIVSGCNDGYFPKVNSFETIEQYKNGGAFEQDRDVIKRINESGAALLLVCLGVPAQELWMNCHRDELNIKLCGGFGGSLDIFAGVSKRAPKIFIKLNCEWLYRLIKEPKRIGRMMALPRFVFGTIFAKKK